jgi:hypothetical protein
MISVLENSGKVQCLRCDDILIYPSNNICKCGNIKLSNKTYSNMTNIADNSERHLYAVYPDEFFEVEKKRILVDMDDTLAFNEYPFYGKANWRLINWLLQLPPEYKIYVYTCRLNPHTVGGVSEAKWHHEQIREYLDKRGLNRFEIWTKTVKPYGGMVIDDNCFAPEVAIRAFKFFNESNPLHHNRTKNSR